MFTVPNGTVAGLMDLPADAADAQIRPGWLGYVAVDDVDAAAARAARLGGVVQVAPTDIGDISRFAIFSDPQAAWLALFKWRRPGQQPPAAPSAPGRVGWHELLAGAEFAMDAPAAPQILITIAARFGRTSWKYSSLAYALILKDAGALTQTLYLMATDMGLGGCAIGTTDIELFAKMTGIEFHVEGAVGQFALGRGAEWPDSGVTA